jgi:hypothetical protein
VDAPATATVSTRAVTRAMMRFFNISMTSFPSG